jgi:hypothetical protein
MRMDENYSKMLDENMAQIESALLAPSNSHFRQHFKTALYPYNITSQSGGGSQYSVNEQDLNGNGDVDSSGYYNSVEKPSRYQPHSVDVKLRGNLVWGKSENCG